MNEQILVSGTINSDKQPLLAGCCQFLDITGLTYFITELSEHFVCCSRHSTVIDFIKHCSNRRYWQPIKMTGCQNQIMFPLFINVTSDGVAVRDGSFESFRLCVNRTVKALFPKISCRSVPKIRLCVTPLPCMDVQIARGLNTPAMIVKYIIGARPADKNYSLQLYQIYKPLLRTDNFFCFAFAWKAPSGSQETQESFAPGTQEVAGKKEDEDCSSPPPTRVIYSSQGSGCANLLELSQASGSLESESKSDVEKLKDTSSAAEQHSAKELESLIVAAKKLLRKAEKNFGQDRVMDGEHLAAKSRKQLTKAHRVRSLLSEAEVSKVLSKRMKQLLCFSELLGVEAGSDEKCDAEIGKNSDNEEDTKKSETCADSDHSEKGKSRAEACQEDNEKSVTCEDSKQSKEGIERSDEDNKFFEISARWPRVTQRRSRKGDCDNEKSMTCEDSKQSKGDVEDIEEDDEKSVTCEDSKQSKGDNEKSVTCEDSKQAEEDVEDMEEDNEKSVTCEDSKQSKGDNEKSVTCEDSKQSKEDVKDSDEDNEKSVTCEDSEQSKEDVKDSEEDYEKFVTCEDSKQSKGDVEDTHEDNEKSVTCVTDDLEIVASSLTPRVEKEIAVIIQMMALYGVRVVLLPREHQGLSVIALRSSREYTCENYMGAKCVLDLLRGRPLNADTLLFTVTDKNFKFCWGVDGFLKALTTWLDHGIGVFKVSTTTSEQHWDFRYRYSLLEKSIPEIANEISLTAPFGIRVAVSFDGCFLLCDHVEVSNPPAFSSPT